MKKRYVFLILLFLHTSAFAQTARFDWLKSLGDSGDDCPGQMANDSSGNLYASGSFVGQLILGTDTLHSTSASSASMFLVKYDSAGNVLWDRKLPVTNPNSIGVCGSVTFNRMRISPSGRIYLLGNINSREYLAVYRSNGSLVGYADQVPGNSDVDVDFDSVDNAYLVGNSGSNAFIIKFDSSGTTKWSYIFHQESQALNVKYTGGVVYITGQFHYQLNLFDTAGSAPITLAATNGINDWDLFSATYTKDGKLLYASGQNGPYSGPAGPFKITGEFTTAGDWRIAMVDGALNGFTCSYSPISLLVLSSSVYAQVLTCPFGGTDNIKADRFSNESICSYSELLCKGTIAHLLNANGRLAETIIVPYAGPGPAIPKQDFSFDKSKHLYVCGNYQGTISYTDSFGNHSLSSRSSSQDIYIGKYHACQKYNPQIAQHTDTVFCSVPGLFYVWLWYNAPQTSGTSNYYVPEESGTIKVVVRDAWGCTDTSGDFAFMMPSNTGVTSNSWSSTLVSVQPNPATTAITISGLARNESFRIVDLTGRTMFSGVAHGSKEPVSVSELAPGVYILQTVRGRAKIVKE